ncbi:hypothetical protein Ddye_019251 [Dipteronia dyeriana]|uniref:DNA-directed RNA polymerase n=1 Tax=Dipteronia dyeriana TaxID=168575 RepID=A0AAD9WUW4_9ROSI|nr:hypothetical protein Ddye_019251 [Dipteronia dyeriana]
MSNNAGSTGGGGDGDKEISNEDVWTVVSALFRSRGFVQNQIDSFNEFFNQTLPEMVTSTCYQLQTPVQQLRGYTILEDNNYRPGPDYLIFHTIHSITFLQLHWDEPTLKESDGEVADLYPNIARLRNFTYSASLYVDV